MKKRLLLFLIGLSINGYAQETLTLSGESTLTVDGTSTVHDWTVAAETLSGSLTMKDNDPQALNFEVEVADIKSERGATMDKKMHEALKKDSHPKVVFALREQAGKTLKGLLTIAGQEKEVAIDPEITSGDGTVTIKGSHTIKLQDYGMEPPSAMFGQIVVGDEVTVNFDLTFSK